MKIITTTVAGVLLAVAPFAVPAVFAQVTTATIATPTSAITAVVKSATSIQATLQAQITQLMQQIKTLQAQIAQIKTTQKTIASSFSTLRAQMRVGSTGQGVKTLQRLLASDPSIYPQGLVTGYYGRLTQDAVKKFQENHGISPVGEVGPETRMLLNSFLKHATSTIPMHFLRRVEGEQRSATSTDHMVIVCHRTGGSRVEVSQRIARRALFYSIKHGDSVGECEREVSHSKAGDHNKEIKSSNGEKSNTGDSNNGSVGESASTTPSEVSASSEGSTSHGTSAPVSGTNGNNTTSGDANGN